MSDDKKITIEFPVFQLSQESQDTVINMITTMLQPLTAGDRYAVIRGLCDNLDVMIFEHYDD
jgi:hypothetical protein